MSVATPTPRSRRPGKALRPPQPLPARPSVAPIAPLQPRSQGRRTSRVSLFPPQPGVPASLQMLVKVQRLSLGLALLLAGSAIVTYGWTVYSQQLWGSALARLEKLRSHERQLTANGELLKNELAKQADSKTSGLVPQSPKHFIFVKPAPPRPPIVETQSPSQPNVRPLPPLGY